MMGEVRIADSARESCYAFAPTAGYVPGTLMDAVKKRDGELLKNRKKVREIVGAALDYFEDRVYDNGPQEHIKAGWVCVDLADALDEVDEQDLATTVRVEAIKVFAGGNDARGHDMTAAQLLMCHPELLHNGEIAYLLAHNDDFSAAYAAMQRRVG
jgi:hypothetical protein